MNRMTADFSARLHQARLGTSSDAATMLSAYRNYLRIAAASVIPKSRRAQLGASDLVQETLLKAQRGFHDFRGSTESQLAAWLRTILRRTLIDDLRKSPTGLADGPRRLMSLESVDSENEVLGRNLLEASGTSPSMTAQRREAGLILADAMAQLTDDHRQVLILRSLEEREWKDVAAMMQRTVAAVRMLWTRALVRLRPLIEDQLS